MCGCHETKATTFHKVSGPNEGFYNTYQLVEKLGQGSYGSVYLARSKAKGFRAMELAVKILDMSTDDVHPKSERMLKIQSEVEVLKLLRGEMRCVQFVDFHEEGNLAYIVMEKCDSSLPKALEDALDVKVPLIANCIQQMLQGLSCIHVMGLVHRDVKPANFVVCGVLGKQHKVKLCDFGSATKVPGEPGNSAALWDVCGTIQFCAPEMLNFVGYGTRADMWSLGVVIHLLLLGQHVYMPRPFSIQKVKTAIQEDRPTPTFKAGLGLSSAHITPSMLFFLKAFLNRDPSQRVSANKALKMEWLRSCLRHTSEQAGKSHQREAGQVSLRPMLIAARKLGAFSCNDRSGAITSLDKKMLALQAQCVQMMPAVGNA